MKITMLQVGMIMTMTIGLLSHVTIITIMLDTSNKDSWISVLLTIPVSAIWVLVPFYISKKTNQENIIAWLGSNTNTFVQFLMRFLFICLFFIELSFGIREVLTWVKISFLPNTPLLVTSIVFIWGCIYCATKGLRGIAITTGVLLPFVWFLGYFVMSANFQFKRYNLLLPMFTTSPYSIVLGMIYMGSALAQKQRETRLCSLLLAERPLCHSSEWISYGSDCSI